MDRFPLHYNWLAHPHCVHWEELIRDHAKRKELAEQYAFTPRSLLRVARKERCTKRERTMSNRDELLFEAREERAMRIAEIDCEWAIVQRNDRRRERGLEEINEYEYCSRSFGGDGWKRYYKGPK